MKAAFIEEVGGTDQIVFGDLETPNPGPKQLLIRNHAVSVNPIDTYVRAGNVAFELPRPYILGCDAAGVVEAVGDDVNDFEVGDRVWCTNQGLLGRQGTFAEKIAVDSEWCFPIPENVDFESAAANALVGVTANLGLFRCARLEPGEAVFVIGGTGGVGAMVVQMAKAAGASVITTAGSDDKCSHAKTLGADHVINYNTSDLQTVLRELAPAGVNVYWETRRDPDFDSAVESLAPRGRMVVMAGRDSRPEFPVGPFYVKECSLHGFVMFKATPIEMARCAKHMNRWMSKGKLVASIAHRLPLSDAARAHEIQESGAAGGKIVLTID